MGDGRNDTRHRHDQAHCARARCPHNKAPRDARALLPELRHDVHRPRSAWSRGRRNRDAGLLPLVLRGWLLHLRDDHGRHDRRMRPTHGGGHGMDRGRECLPSRRGSANARSMEGIESLTALRAFKGEQDGRQQAHSPRVSLVPLTVKRLPHHDRDALVQMGDNGLAVRIHQDRHAASSRHVGRREKIVHARLRIDEHLADVGHSLGVDLHETFFRRPSPSLPYLYSNMLGLIRCENHPLADQPMSLKRRLTSPHPKQRPTNAAITVFVASLTHHSLPAFRFRSFATSGSSPRMNASTAR